MRAREILSWLIVALLLFAGATTIAPGGGANLANAIGTLKVANGGTGLATLTGLALGNGTSNFSAYAGAGCTNQFPRSLNASGAATCASVANGDLAGSIAASKLVGTDIATLGTITAGTWNGTAISATYGGGIKAWAAVSRSGSTLTIDAGYNITSGTYNSTGNYTLNFTSSLADGNYAVVVQDSNTNLQSGAGNGAVTSRATGSFVLQYQTIANVAADVNNFFFIVIR